MVADDKLMQQRRLDCAKTAADWYWETDTEGRYVWLSDAVEQVTGVPAEWHYGKTRADIGVHLANPEQWNTLNGLIASRQAFYDFEFLRQGPDGLRHIRVSGTPYFNEQGAFAGYRGSGRIITHALPLPDQRNSNVQLQLLTAIDTLPDMFALFDMQQRLVLCNRSYMKLYEGVEIKSGMPYRQLIRKLLQHGALYEAKGRETRWYRERLRRFQRAEPLFEIQYGPDAWYELRQRRLRDGAMVLIGTDISARKKAEIARSKQSQLMRSVLNTIDQGITALDKQMCLVAWNREFESIFQIPTGKLRIGAHYQELVQHSFDAGFISADNFEQLFDEWAQRVKAVEPYRLLRLPDGRSIEIRRIAMQDDGVITSFTDITRFKLAEKRILESEQSFRRLLESSKHGCFIQADWQLLYVNTTFAQMLKYDNTDEMYALSSLDELLTSAEQVRLKSFAARRLAGQQVPSEYEYDAVRKDGSIVRLQQAVSLIQWNDRRAYFCSVIDMTAHKQTEQALIKARMASDQMARVKSEFLANMSHEIRTPLHGILGTTQMLQRTALDKEQQHYTDVISRSGEALVRLIDDILDFSRIEANKLQIIKAAFDLPMLLQDSMALFGESARQKQLQWQLQIDPELPQYIFGDAMRLRQIVLNLLSNAIKFTERGSVTLNVSVASCHEQHYQIRFLVEDTGIGIAAEKLPNLFDYFTQIESSASRSYGGAGLGLAISKKIAILMGGDLGASSEVNQGTRFYAEIPFVAANSAEITAAKEKPTQQQVSPAHDLPLDANVLLVEDNLVNQQLALAMLKNLGYRVDLANNGAEALKAIADASKRYDVILMDCQMPSMDGYQATVAIRQDERQQQLDAVPIIALSASVLKEDQERCYASGMNDFLAKPFQQSELANKLHYWLKQQQMIEKV